MRKIRIAQIGVNRYSHAPEIFHTLTKFPDIFEIVGYVLVEDERETCQSKMKWLAGYRELTLDEVLNDETIEAVTVETDEIHLTKYALLAAAHGKHIHMEKPGGVSHADFTRLIEAMRESGKVFHVGYMYRYNPYIHALIEDAKAGKLGVIHSVEAHMSRLDPKTTREWFSSFPGGMMFYLGCHLIDLVLQIKGKPLRIYPMNRATGYDGVNTEDYGFAVLEYPEGMSFVKMCGAEVGGSRRRQLVVAGERKTVEIKPLEAGIKGTHWRNTVSKTEHALDESGHTVTTASESEAFDRYETMMQSFAAMVRGEKENPYSLEYELYLHETVLRCCGAEV